MEDLEKNKDHWRALFDEYDEKKNLANPFEQKRLRWSGNRKPAILDLNGSFFDFSLAA